jgi:hypothetical protein
MNLEQQHEQTNRFRTYLHYFKAFSQEIDSHYSNPEEFGNQLMSHRKFKGLQGGKLYDEPNIERCLRNAWFTELQTAFPATLKDYLHFANHWICVQVYYSTYLALRAYFHSKGLGQQIGREHASNLKEVSEDIKKRPALFPYPFCLLCEGNPEKTDSIIFSNTPNGVHPIAVSNLARPVEINSLDYIAKFLKTTRKKALEKVCEDWKNNEKRKRMCSIKKNEIIQNMPSTSIFSALYRMRIRSNYVDADTFLMSIAREDESSIFYDSQRKMLWHTLFIFESLILKHVGKNRYSKWIDNFNQHETTRISKDLVLKRWEIQKDKI